MKANSCHRNVKKCGHDNENKKPGLFGPGKRRGVRRVAPSKGGMTERRSCSCLSVGKQLEGDFDAAPPNGNPNTAPLCGVNYVRP